MDKQQGPSVEHTACILYALPWWLRGQEAAYKAEDAGDTGLIPGSERSAGGRNDNLLQYSCLENPMDGVPGGP